MRYNYNYSNWARGMMWGPLGPNGQKKNHYHEFRRAGKGLGLGVIGAVFLAPVLLAGGWIFLTVIGWLLGMAGWVLDSAFEGVGFAVDMILSGLSRYGGLALAIAAGYLLVRWLRNRKAEKRETETAAAAGAENAEMQAEEPAGVYHTYRA